MRWFQYQVNLLLKVFIYFLKNWYGIMYIKLYVCQYLCVMRCKYCSAFWQIVVDKNRTATLYHNIITVITITFTALFIESIQYFWVILNIHCRNCTTWYCLPLHEDLACQSHPNHKSYCSITVRKKLTKRSISIIYSRYDQNQQPLQTFCLLYMVSITYDNFTIHWKYKI